MHVGTGTRKRAAKAGGVAKKTTAMQPPTESPAVLSPAPSPSERPGGRQHHKLKGWQVVLTYGLLVVAITLVHVGLANIGFGRYMELWGYEKLRSYISPPSEPIPITLVDLSRVPKQAIDRPAGADRVNATNRAVLKQVITHLLTLKPKAIAVDVDMSPDEYGPIEGDEDLLQFCASAGKETKIFFVANRSLARSPDEWLGSPKFTFMAVHTLVAPEAHTQGIALDELEIPGQETMPPSLPRALAQSNGPQLKERDTNMEQLLFPVEQDFRFTSNGVPAHGYFVNEGMIDVLNGADSGDHLIQVSGTGDFQDQPELIQGRMILIGDAQDDADKLFLPGREERVPGLFFQAASTYTMAQSPLYVFKEWFVLVLNLVFATVTLLAVLGLRKLARKLLRLKQPLRKEFVSVVVALFAIFLTVGMGVALVAYSHVLWLDFILFAIVFAIHGTIERVVEHAFSRSFWKGEYKKMIFEGEA